jgi:hypothetical protein
MTDQPLTPAQARILADVRAAGSKTYTGVARPAIKELERRGLVTVNWDMHLVTKGGGSQARWRITVTPPTKGKPA